MRKFGIKPTDCIFELAQIGYAVKNEDFCSLFDSKFINYLKQVYEIRHHREVEIIKQSQKSDLGLLHNSVEKIKDVRSDGFMNSEDHTLNSRGFKKLNTTQGGGSQRSHSAPKLHGFSYLDPLRLDELVLMEVERLKSQIVRDDVTHDGMLSKYCMLWMLVGKKSAEEISRLAISEKIVAQSNQVSGKKVD